MSPIPRALLVCSLVGCSAPAQGPREASSDVATLARGAALFAVHCAICHGPRGDGHGKRRMGLERLPRFDDPDWRAEASYPEVLMTIEDGKRGTPMPSWKWLGARDVRALASYVLSLATAAPDEAARSTTSPR